MHSKPDGYRLLRKQQAPTKIQDHANTELGSYPPVSLGRSGVSDCETELPILSISREAVHVTCFSSNLVIHLRIGWSGSSTCGLVSVMHRPGFQGIRLGSSMRKRNHQKLIRSCIEITPCNIAILASRQASMIGNDPSLLKCTTGCAQETNHSTRSPYSGRIPLRGGRAFGWQRDGRVVPGASLAVKLSVGML